MEKDGGDRLQKLQVRRACMSTEVERVYTEKNRHSESVHQSSVQRDIVFMTTRHVGQTPPQERENCSIFWHEFGHLAAGLQPPLPPPPPTRPVFLARGRIDLVPPPPTPGNPTPQANCNNSPGGGTIRGVFEAGGPSVATTLAPQASPMAGAGGKGTGKGWGCAWAGGGTPLR